MFYRLAEGQRILLWFFSKKGERNGGGSEKLNQSVKALRLLPPMGLVATDDENDDFKAESFSAATRIRTGVPKASFVEFVFYRDQCESVMI